MLFPAHAFEHAPQLETQKALLLLDFQNDFVSNRGHLFVPNIIPFLPKLTDLVTKFRNSGQVVWTRTEYRRPCESFSPLTGADSILLKSTAQRQKWRTQSNSSNLRQPPIQEQSEDDEDEHESENHELPADPEAFLAAEVAAPFQRCCQPDTSGSAIPAKLAECIDATKDVVITKSDYSAFADPTLLLQLRMRLITDLYVCGSLSNITVYATVLDAVRNGFNVTLVEDCLGYRDIECHIAAMTDMADGLGAHGIDFQELMDDLAGLLGDAVDESQYTRRFQLSMTPMPDASRPVASSQRVSEWVASIEDDTDSFTTALEHQSTRAMTPQSQISDRAQQQHKSTESPADVRTHATSPGLSPSRKRRAVSEQDNLSKDKDHTSAKRTGGRRASYDGFAKQSNMKKKKPARRSGIFTAREQPNSAASPTTPELMVLNQSPPADVELESHVLAHDKEIDQLEISPITALADNVPSASQTHKKKKTQRTARTFIESTDTIGDGDCALVLDINNENVADMLFHSLKTKTHWQKMYHRTGEVPRLVAVQGTVASSGAIPIYRHPADESPELLPFDATVLSLKQICEELVGHPLNHALIQYYRSGEDNISEHSDKTLDIAHGSKIVNVSFGATRTMTLRTKKESPPTNNESNNSNNNDPPARKTQHIRLPSASAFILGPTTNANWLHSIRPDRRPESEKTEEERMFDGERISLTFRQIATFIDPQEDLIWGQGAKSKSRASSNRILSGEEAEREGEKMIIGFGKENHLNAEGFDWDEVYGEGFDVVNFVTRPAVSHEPDIEAPYPDEPEEGRSGPRRERWTRF